MVSGYHMVGGWDPDEAVAVVNSRFCADRHVYLRIQERRSWTGNEFDISDDTTKQPWFQVAAKACGCCRRKTLVDLGGDVVATLRSPAILHSSRMHVKGRGFSFHIIRKLKIFRKEAKAEVTDLISGQTHTLYMYGNWTARKLTVHLGKKKHSGKVLAHGERENKRGSCDTYVLTVLPGMDCALSAILTVAFNGFFNVYN